MLKPVSLLLGALLLSTVAIAQSKYVPSEEDVAAILPSMQALYLDLHQNPELSWHEVQTSQKMADGLRKLGFEVTTGVGKNGVVGVLRNGEGPTVMIRTDMDALPVPEKTGLPYASKVTTKDDTGATVPVMHACGHDLHMSSWMGTATLLSKSKDRWKGTVVMIGQPAEERGSGAEAMLKDGLYSRFPKPDYVIGFHDSPLLAAGTVSVVSGYALSNANSVDITVFGKGGHGAAPQATVDPIVIAARIILSLQTIVSRELNPQDPAVITVGSIHGGTKHNIIPDEVKLQLTVRSYKDSVQAHLLSSIARIAKAEAMAAGAPREPEVMVSDSTHATYNDPALSERLTAAMKKGLGAGQVVAAEPIMASEDFSEYGRAGVPAVIFWVGGVDPARFAEAKKSGQPLPSLHSPLWAPAMPESLKTAIRAETIAALELLGNR